MANKALANVTARAFENETLMRHVFPKAKGRVTRIERLHRPMLRASATQTNLRWTPTGPDLMTDLKAMKY